jgi:hypothetical protein
MTMRPFALLLVAGLVAAACGGAPPTTRTAIADVVFDREPIIVIDPQFVAVDLDGDGVEAVTIDASRSSDLDGDVTGYQFTRGLDVVSTDAVYTGEFAVGEHVVTLRITDDDGLTDIQAIVVRVLVPYEKSSENSPEIDLWGPGLAANLQPTVNQRWFNILGNVSDPDGILELKWSLNGSSDQPLELGPNDRRLVREGDFNIDILRSSLLLDTNTVEITAVDRQGERTTALVRIENERIDSPDFPIEIDWKTQQLDGLVEVVDGGWFIDEAADELVMSSDFAGYDRLVSVGDMNWRDYDVRTSVVVDEVFERISPYSTIRGFGLLLRWNGHNNSVAPGSQPLAGFYPDRGQNLTPFGSFVLYTFQASGDALVLQDHRSVVVDESTDVEVEVSEKYNLRAQAQTITNGTVYRAKIWPAAEPEPDEWSVSYVAGSTDFEPSAGSLILVSHETATRWGPVSIRSVRDDERLTDDEIEALRDPQP